MLIEKEGLEVNPPPPPSLPWPFSTEGATRKGRGWSLFPHPTPSSHIGLLFPVRHLNIFSLLPICIRYFGLLKAHKLFILINQGPRHITLQKRTFLKNNRCFNCFATFVCKMKIREIKKIR